VLQEDRQRKETAEVADAIAIVRIAAGPTIGSMTLCSHSRDTLVSGLPSWLRIWLGVPLVFGLCPARFRTCGPVSFDE